MHKFRHGFEKIAREDGKRHVKHLVGGAALGAGVGLGAHMLTRKALMNAGKYVAGALGGYAGLRAGHTFYENKRNREAQAHYARALQRQRTR